MSNLKIINISVKNYLFNLFFLWIIKRNIKKDFIQYWEVSSQEKLRLYNI